MLGSLHLWERLLQTDEGLRQLAERHHDLDARLTELLRHHHPSGSEEIEKATLKKRKLRLKDQMEDILRRRRTLAAGPGANLERSDLKNNTN